MFLRILEHGTELGESEELPVPTDTLLPIENRTRGSDFDEDGYNQQHWSQQNDPSRRRDEVQDVLTPLAIEALGHKSAISPVSLRPATT